MDRPTDETNIALPIRGTVGSRPQRGRADDCTTTARDIVSFLRQVDPTAVRVRRAVALLRIAAPTKKIDGSAFPVSASAPQTTHNIYYTLRQVQFSLNDIHLNLESGLIKRKANFTTPNLGNRAT